MRVIITGISGAGKTLALKFLQDLGYFCVDNLPVGLMEQFFSQTGYARRKVALGIDIRERKHFPLFLKLSSRLKSHRIIFLECSTDELVRRFSANRRKPPFAGAGGGIAGVIRSERRQLEKIKEISDLVIDTTQLNPWQLKRIITDRVGFPGPFQIDILSFGYRYGIPPEADVVYDLRFLPNPNYERRLGPLSGKSVRVSRFVKKSLLYKRTLKAVVSFLRMILPAYKKTGKSCFTVAVGCTGGRHRSIVFAEDLKKRLGASYRVKAIHRDIKKRIAAA